jgi:hypothetical protein
LNCLNGLWPVLNCPSGLWPILSCLNGLWPIFRCLNRLWHISWLPPRPGEGQAHRGSMWRLSVCVSLCHAFAFWGARDSPSLTQAKRPTGLTASEASGRRAVCSRSEHREKGRGPLSPAAGRAGLMGGGWSLGVSRTFPRPSGFGGGGRACRDREREGKADHRPAGPGRERGGRPF